MFRGTKMAATALVTSLFIAGMVGLPAEARHHNSAAANAAAMQMYAQQQAANAYNASLGTQQYQATQAMIQQTANSLPPYARQAYMNKLASEYWGAVNSGTYNPYTTQFDYSPTNLGLYANPNRAPYGYPY